MRRFTLSAAYPFDAVVLHSCSRLFRTSFAREMYESRFLETGVRLIATALQLTDEPSPVMARRTYGTSTHTSRS